MFNRRNLLSAWLFIPAMMFALMSGCIDAAPESESPDPGPPEWRVGDWWEYSVEGALPASWMDSENTFDGARDLDLVPRFSVDTTARFTTAPDLNVDGPLEGKPRRVVTDDPEVDFLTRLGLPLAANWAIDHGTSWSHSVRDWTHVEGNSITPHLEGPRFFDWPLEDGKRWDTEFMRVDLAITAARSTHGFMMEATLEGEPVLRYEYDLEAKWFRSFNVLDDGQVVLAADMLNHGDQFSGKVYAYNLNASESAGCMSLHTPLPADTGPCPFPLVVYEGGSTSFRIYFDYRSTGPGLMSVVRENPAGTPEAWHNEACPCDSILDVTEGPMAPGMYVWHINSILSDDRYLYFMGFSRCFSEYEVENGVFDRVDLCSRD